MFWFQGWDDAKKSGAVKQVETNLVNLVEDLRKEIGDGQKVPVVIAQTGNLRHGDEQTQVYGGNQKEGCSNCKKNHVAMETAQKAAAAAIKGKAKYVSTEDLFPGGRFRVNGDLNGGGKFPGECTGAMSKHCTGPDADPAHWNHNAASYLMIGERMGKAMADLLNQEPSQPFRAYLP